MINDGLTHFLNGMGGTSRVVLGMILGGMMSIDMGGPFNKAAYVFGTAQLAEGNFEVMAAVMAGGMVPPIAIALCTTFFKKKFTEKERQSGVVNYVMGLSFITEGAIPFAAQDPLRVIPSCLIGSAIAGGLSMASWLYVKSTSRRIIRTATIGNPVMYLAAVVIGSVVGCVILGILKKERGRIKYCIFPCIAGESRYILKGVFYSSPAKGETAGLFLCKAVNEKDRSLIDVLI